MITSILTVYKDQQQELENVIHPFNLYLSHTYCMCKDRRTMKALHMTYSRVSLGKKVSRHEMTPFCDLWLRGHLSSIQRHDISKSNYISLTCAFYVICGYAQMLIQECYEKHFASQFNNIIVFICDLFVSRDDPLMS